MDTQGAGATGLCETTPQSSLQPIPFQTWVSGGACFHFSICSNSAILWDFLYLCVHAGLEGFLEFLLAVHIYIFLLCVLAEWGVGGGRMSICRGQRSTLVSSQPFFSFFVCDRIPHWTCIHISASMAGEWGPIFSRVSLSSITSAYRCAQMLHGVAGHMNPGTPASSQTVLWTEPSL